MRETNRPAAPKYRISPRANRVWGKLQDWYGDALDQYGPFPPEDWCEVIDAASNEAERIAMSEIRAKHTAFPPRFPEFDAIFSRISRPQTVSGPSIMERLIDFVIRTKPLTRNQQRGWTFVGQEFDSPGLDGKMRHRHGVNITGIVIPPDGDSPGYRVMLADLDLHQDIAA